MWTIYILLEKVTALSLYLPLLPATPQNTQSESIEQLGEKTSSDCSEVLG